MQLCYFSCLSRDFTEYCRFKPWQTDSICLRPADLSMIVPIFPAMVGADTVKRTASSK